MAGSGGFEGEMSVDETQMLMQYFDQWNDERIGEILGEFEILNLIWSFGSCNEVCICLYGHWW